MASRNKQPSFVFIPQGTQHFKLTPTSSGVISPLRSSYERGCQEKKILPAPPEDAGVVTCIQPHLIPRLILIHRGVVGLVALARCRFQQRCQPQLFVPTQRFHENSGARRHSVPKLRKPTLA